MPKRIFLGNRGEMNVKTLEEGLARLPAGDYELIVSPNLLKAAKELALDLNEHSKLYTMSVREETNMYQDTWYIISKIDV